MLSHWSVRTLLAQNSMFQRNQSLSRRELRHGNPHWLIVVRTFSVTERWGMTPFKGADEAPASRSIRPALWECAMTLGATAETVDGMSTAKIDAIIDALRHERYRWTPARRTYIEKKNSTKKRPLGIPTWSDKFLQEVMRLILEAYYEPPFSSTSHGFRPRKGCHTALDEICHKWVGPSGSLRATSPTASILWTTRSWNSWWAKRSTTTASCGCSPTCSGLDISRTGVIGRSVQDELRRRALFLIEHDGLTQGEAVRVVGVQRQAVNI